MAELITNRDADLGNDEPTAHDAASGPPSKKKQKRNKPTLSCEECVERKTKVRTVMSYVAYRAMDLNDFE